MTQPIDQRSTPPGTPSPPRASRRRAAWLIFGVVAFAWSVAMLVYAWDFIMPRENRSATFGEFQSRVREVPEMEPAPEEAPPGDSPETPASEPASPTGTAPPAAPSTDPSAQR